MAKVLTRVQVLGGANPRLNFGYLDANNNNAFTSAFNFKPIGNNDQTGFRIQKHDAGLGDAGALIQLHGIAAVPSAADAAASKAYVDQVATGLDVRQSCQAATTTNITLNAALVVGGSIDGVTLEANDRVLVKDQTTKQDNGIYVINAGANPTRATDMVAAAAGPPAVTATNAAGMFTFIMAGTTNKNRGFVFTNGGAAAGSGDSQTATVGVDDLDVAPFSSAGGGNFVRTDTVDTISAAHNFTGKCIFSAEQSFTSADGIKVGKLTIKDGPSDGSAFSLSSGSFQVGSIIESTADIQTTTNVQANQFTATSDRRLKKDIKYTTPGDALRQVLHMRPATYAFKSDPGKPRQGVIAQDLLAVAPSLVDTVNKGTEKEHLAVNYIDMIASLVGAVHGLQEQIDELREAEE